MEKDKAGRPRKWTDPIEFEGAVNAYFAHCTAAGELPVIAELCYFLGFHDKQSLDNYQNYEGFSLTVKAARLRIEAAKNKALFNRNYPSAGVIFDLKNNHGWTDKQEWNDVTPKEYGEAVRTARRDAIRATVPEDEDDDPPMV